MSRIFAVAGSPVFHSKSPAMFNTAFRELAIDAIYVRLAASTAEEVIATAREIGINGLNVTSPFKTRIMGYVDAVEGDAERVGSVNTVVRTEGRFVGYNTDIAGVLGAVRSGGFDPSGRKAVVVGAEGAAKAAALALVSAGAQVVLTNRTPGKARDAAEKLGCTALPLDRIGEALADAHLLVSAISSRSRVIEPSLLSRRLVVLDANYGHPSALLEDATRAGCTVIDGREWLLAQAVPAFTLFAARPAPVDLMRKALWKTRRDGRKNIALIGFMGAGKSAVAEELGILSGMAVVDIDNKIEEKEGCSIAEIFERKGEERFRRMEQAEIDELRLVSHHIVSCGGGTATNRANVRVLRNNCLSVWLWADVLTALGRIDERATRPLLKGENPEAAARALLAERLSSYARTCDLLIDTKEKKPREIAERIWNEVRDAFAS